MLTITLPPDLDRAIREQAQERGMAPEELAVEGLRDRFLTPSSASMSAEAATMAGFLGDLIGCFDSRDIVPGGGNLSDESGRKFAEILIEKRSAGKL